MILVGSSTATDAPGVGNIETHPIDLHHTVLATVRVESCKTPTIATLSGVDSIDLGQIHPDPLWLESGICIRMVASRCWCLIKTNMRFQIAW